MGRPVYLPKAEADLDSIWNYLQERNPKAVRGLIERIFEVCDRLATEPFMGRARSEIARGLRSFPAKGYVVFYRPTEDAIEVVRVIDGRRDLKKAFSQ